MSLFQYKARDSRGKEVTGTMEARNIDNAASQLANSGLVPVNIVALEEKSSRSSNLNGIFAKKVSTNDLLQFCRQMHTLVKAGVPLLDAINGLTGIVKNPLLEQALRGVVNGLQGGQDLASAMSTQKNVFNLFFVNMVRVGESTGKLSEIFKSLAVYLDRDKKARDQVKAAMRYPTFVIAAVGIAFLVINIFVIPTFSNIFKSIGSELPLMTRALMGMSNMLVKHWGILLGAIASITLFFKYYVETPSGRLFFDKNILKLPLVGSILHRAIMARFASLFSMAMSAGVPVVANLNVVSEALNNSYISKKISSMKTGVERGESISRTAAQTGMFDTLVIQMISVGEKTGAVDDLLAEVADYYEREVEYDISKLSSSIEPILTVFIGVMVLMLALGIFMPMWSMGSAALHK